MKDRVHYSPHIYVSVRPSERCNKELSYPQDSAKNDRYSQVFHRFSTSEDFPLLHEGQKHSFQSSSLITHTVLPFFTPLYLLPVILCQFTAVCCPADHWKLKYEVCLSVSKGYPQYFLYRRDAL